MTDINGCACCGLLERGHGKRWNPLLGWHSYFTPTDYLRLKRLKERREGRRD